MKVGKENGNKRSSKEGKRNGKEGEKREVDGNKSVNITSHITVYLVSG